MSECAVEMPRYQSHKVVHALKIKDIRYVSAVDDPDAESDGTMLITPEESGYAPFKVGPEYTRKHQPKAGGYYVVYPDGYLSWSPAEAFESGYTRLP